MAGAWYRRKVRRRFGIGPLPGTKLAVERDGRPPGASPLRRAQFDDALRAAVLRAVKNAPRFSGAALQGDPPVLCIEAPTRTQRADLSADLMVVPYGWDASFGGVLTITAITKAAGWLGRVVVHPTDKVFGDLKNGRITLAIVADGKLVDAFVVDLASSALNYEEQWLRVRDHVPVLDDPRSAALETIHSQRMVLEKRLLPEDRLALGWVKRYRDAVSHLAWTLSEAPADVVARAEARLVDEKGSFAERLLRIIVERGTTVPALAGWIRSLRAENEEEFVGFVMASREIHSALHAVGGDHTPLCQLHARLIDVELLSPDSTANGQKLRWLSKSSARFESLTLEPRAFPQGVDPEVYWARLNVPLAWNWGTLVSSRDVHADLTVNSKLWSNLPRAEHPDESDAAADALLSEAVTSKKWTVPPGAEIELPVGPFVRMTAWEIDDEVFFVLRTDTGEFAVASLEPAKSYFGFSGEFGVAPEEATLIDAALKLLLSAVVRDFFVVEEREKVFAHKQASKLRVRKGGDEEGPRIVYLPRVRYTNATVARGRTELGQVERSRHDVGPHLRKAAHASDHQLWLARTYGFSVPQGHTFVRPHHRGERAREVIYRSRSALSALYEAVPTPAGAQSGPAPWFQFERDVAQLLSSLGFAVEHVAAGRRGDGGVDVYATKGDDLETVRWVIQCKRYQLSRPVGPHVVRELVGTLAEYPRGTRGMIVTTSSFSADAQASAERADVRLMAGAEFAERLRTIVGD